MKLKGYTAQQNVLLRAGDLILKQRGEQHWCRQGEQAGLGNKFPLQDSA